MKAVALIANLDKPNAGSVAWRICAWLKARNIAVWAQEELLCGDARFPSANRCPPWTWSWSWAGTALSSMWPGAIPAQEFLSWGSTWADWVSDRSGSGRIGQCFGKGVRRAVHHRAAGHALRAGLPPGQSGGGNLRSQRSHHCQRSLARIIRLDVCVDNVPIGSYNGDGLIVSTPTGSTGYSLSAGGPIVASNVDLLLITPICPHTLSARPIAVARNAVIDVTLMSVQPEIVLTVDGQHSFSLEYGDRLTITDAKVETLLLRCRAKTFLKSCAKIKREQNR